MKIKVIGLFGKYNHEIDLDKRCNILIGENGIGKSTFLKAIDYLFKYDFYLLSSIYFEKIILSSLDYEIEINYHELIPKSEILKKEYEKIFIAEYGKELYHQLEESRQLKTPLVMFNHIIEVSGHNYNNFIRETLFGKVYSTNSKKYLREGIGFWTEKEFKKTIKSICSLEQKDKLSNYIKGAEIDKKINTIIDLLKKYSEESNIFFLNMVENYNVNFEKKYQFKITNKQILNILNEKIEIEKSNSKLIGISGIKSTKEDRYYYKRVFDEIGNIKDIFSGNNIKCQFRKYNVFKDVAKNKTVNISEILRNDFFNKNFIVKINEKMIPYYEQYILDIDKKSPNYEKLKNDEINKAMNYIYPFVVKQSPFDIDLSYTMGEFDDESQFLYASLPYYVRYYRENIESILSSSPEKIKKFNYLVEKYIKNKKVRALPTGLNISFSEDDVSDDMRGENLSSGEKKLLIIFAICIFYENTILLLDEPELSLSIRWQESLLLDILDQTSIKKIIVATHSPNIVSDERLFKNLVFLPKGEKNEQWIKSKICG